VVAVSPDGKLVLAGTIDGKLYLWDRFVRGKLRAWAAHSGVVTALGFRRNGQTVLSASADGAVALWQVADERRLHALQHEPSNIIWAACFSPDPGGELVLSASGDGTARLWEANTGKELYRLPHGAGVPVFAAVFDPDGKKILTGSGDRNARIWDRDLNETVRFSGHSAEVVTVAFSPNGETALTGSNDRTARLWDTSGRQIGRPLTHGGPVTVVAFSPNKDMTLTGTRGTALTGNGGTDPAAYFWDGATGLPLGPPLPHSGRVSAVAFNRDGTLAMTGSHDGTVRLWKVPVPPPGWKAPVRLPGDVERIRLWVQVVTGMELDVNGAPQELASEAWRQRVQRLKEKDPWPNR
jgi:WD40 repeat protein